MKAIFYLYTSSFSHKFSIICKKLIDDYSSSNGISKLDAEDKLLKILCCNRTTLYNYMNGSKTPSDDDIIFFTKSLQLQAEALIDDSPSGHGMIERIRRVFLTLDAFICYKITIFYKYYLRIHDNAWNFIVNYCLLNDLGRSELKRYLFENIIDNIGMVVESLDNIIMFQEAKRYSNYVLLDEFKQDKEAYLIKMKYKEDNLYIQNLWSSLDKQFQDTSCTDQERFFQ